MNSTYRKEQCYTFYVPIGVKHGEIIHEGEISCDALKLILVNASVFVQIVDFEHCLMRGKEEKYSFK